MRCLLFHSDQGRLRLARVSLSLWILFCASQFQCEAVLDVGEELPVFSSLSCVAAVSKCALSLRSLPCVAAGSKCALSSLSSVTARGECASPNISLLDVWAGVSSFSEAWELQSHCSVAEHAWIE
jgi:hypothetical protein